MGVDLLDVSFRIERELGVSLKPEDWYELARDRQDFTAGQLYQLIQQRLELQKLAHLDLSVNERFWRTLQASISRVRGCPTSAVQLSTALNDVFAAETLREDLLAVEQDSGFQVPLLHLQRAPATEAVLIIIGVTAAILAAALERYLDSMLLLAAFGAAAGCVSYLSRGTDLRRFQQMKTVKSLCRYVRDNNLERIGPRSPAVANSADVWRRLKDVIVDSLGVDDDEVCRDAWFVRDLGLE